METNTNTNTGAYISLAGIIISVAQHYNVTLDQSSVVSVLAAVAIITGWIHQWATAKKLKKVAVEAGVKGIK